MDRTSRSRGAVARRPIERGRQVAARFDPVAIYASPFVRALETARLIGDVLGLEPIVVDALLRTGVRHAARPSLRERRARSALAHRSVALPAARRRDARRSRAARGAGARRDRRAPSRLRGRRRESRRGDGGAARLDPVAAIRGIAAAQRERGRLGRQRAAARATEFLGTRWRRRQRGDSGAGASGPAATGHSGVPARAELRGARIRSRGRGRPIAARSAARASTASASATSP